MDNRREFLKKVAVLSGGAGVSHMLPSSVIRALSINPDPGSTYMDAEHVVLLMQENRSFDHCFGSLRGVRGFNDPRAITLPGGNPVWLQENATKETYAPFRLNFKDSRSTWMGSLPHSRESQVDARNNGRYDGWLEAKRSGEKEYAHIPLTMGYYTREDLPFYYALADGFTICDQHFCASLTPTSPNRLYYWTGTVRDSQNADAKANVRNEDIDYGTVSWHTFPEQLEKNGISWKVYQNDISVDTGMTDEQGAWLSNYSDNPLEYFSQYHVNVFPRHVAALQQKKQMLSAGIIRSEEQLKSSSPPEEIKAHQQLVSALQEVNRELAQIEQDKGVLDSEMARAIHEKAFTTNDRYPDFNQLSGLDYQDGPTERQMQVPRGDVLNQFRDDVNKGQLPAVSWIVAAENFSDHPSAPWYGAWFVSEVLDILTRNPEVWKKTIFMLTYDENDGYFDHVPPFVSPKPGHPETGIVSAGIDTAVEYVTLEQELGQSGLDKKDARESSIGLGYRVPLIIASPWSRGGMVCSQVFDHTSGLQFLEHFLSHKTGKEIRESNISDWRRTVCGNLNSVFRPYQEENAANPPALSRDPYLELVQNAKFKKLPSDYHPLNEAQIREFRNHPSDSPFLPKQEPGIRPSCALPYQLYADGRLDAGRTSFGISLESKKTFFKERSAGSPFTVYAPGNGISEAGKDHFGVWSFAVKAGDRLTYQWPLKDFSQGKYHIRVYGPNGFFREFRGDQSDPALDITCEYAQRPGIAQPDGNLELQVVNLSEGQPYRITVTDLAYRAHNHVLLLEKPGTPRSNASLRLDLQKTYGWYDFSVRVEGNNVFEKRYAGRVENGKPGFSDPAMGKIG